LQKNFGNISPDMPGMLLNYLNGKNNSWAIRACYAQFELGMYTVAPAITKVNNIGFGGNATHTKTRNRFDQPIDISDLRKFDFRADFPVSNRIIRQYRNKYSVISRVLAKVMNLVSR
jgi:hypothetical protein